MNRSTLPFRRSSSGHRNHLLALVLAGCLAVPMALAAQEDPWELGVAGSGLLLRQLDGTKRVLMIGAHPDDEDTSLLAALARGRGARTAYLSLTRGDGGQNLIGPELDEGLGVIRTGELVSARALDGGVQYFTRAFDFGYSKRAEEALELWPRQELLRDVVHVIRTFRPHVVVSIFSGTPADGHGQHQAAGIAAREGFRMAGDPARYPEQLDEGLEAWQPLKLYRLAWRDPAEADLRVSTGTFDPLLGASHHQVAMASRSLHRSQDMGAPRPLGPRFSRLKLVETAPGLDAEPEADLFAGVDTALLSLADALSGSGREEVVSRLRGYRRALAEARDSLNALRPWAAAPPLARGLEHLTLAREAAAREPDRVHGLLEVLDHRVEGTEEALRNAVGVIVDVRVDDDLVVPGQEVTVVVELWNGGPWTVRDAVPGLELPVGWSARPLSEMTEDRGRGPFSGGGGATAASPEDLVAVPPGESVVWRWTVQLPPDADLSRLYYLEEPRDGAMYRWPDAPDLRGLPRQPPPVHGAVTFALDLPPSHGGGTPGADRAAAAGDVSAAPGTMPVLHAREPARYVGVDKAQGEFRTPTLVVPAVSVRPEPRVLVVPEADAAERGVTVSLRAFAPDGLRGTVELQVPEGWNVEPRRQRWDMSEGQDASFAFRVRPPADAAAGSYALRAVARSEDGRTFTEAVDLIDYPHIDRAAMFEPAETRVTVVPVRIAPDLRVGYVMGSGDEGPEALRQLGATVDLLEPAALRDGDLDAFDVLVLGVRAYETRPDLAANNQRVLDFAREGGTVLVQYNKYEFPQGGFAPYPVDIARPHDRVTDEGSPVRFLDPESPVVTTPNRLDPTEDFRGWVTERGLYFLGEWDERYTAVLELTDPGEEPKRGSILVTPLGDGLWIYTGLSFFRQLPEGVPGAYRLFANLVSLDAETWRASEGSEAGDAREDGGSEQAEPRGADAVGEPERPAPGDADWSTGSAAIGTGPGGAGGGGDPGGAP